MESFVFVYASGLYMLMLSSSRYPHSAHQLTYPVMLQDVRSDIVCTQGNHTEIGNDTGKGSFSLQRPIL